MSRYANALGRMEFTVDGEDFSLKPKKGDNLRLIKLQKKSGEDHSKLMEEMIPFVTELINREEGFAEDSEEYEELETFVEYNVMEFVKEILIAFRWTTREEFERAEQSQLESSGFLETDE